MSVHNEELILIEVNKTLCEMVGYSKDELLGKPVVDITYKVDVDKEIRLSERLFKGEISNYKVDKRYVTKQGDIIWVSQTTTMIHANGNDPIFGLGIVEDISERKQNEFVQDAFVSMATTLRNAQNRSELFPIILDQIQRILRVEGMLIAVKENPTGNLVIEGTRGLWTQVNQDCFSGGFFLNGLSGKGNQPVINYDIRGDSSLNSSSSLTNVKAVAGIPLITKEDTIGVLWVGKNQDFSEDEIRILLIISEMAANAIQRATLFESLQQKKDELALAYDETLEGWSRALEMRDVETKNHAHRVADMSVRLAKEMEMSDEEIVHIYRGALLHDIGKIALPDSILLKPDSLLEEEWDIIHQHPVFAYQMLSPIEYLHPSLDIPYCHHEKWDGTGYPRGLKGKDIPLAARLFAVVDVWDALLSDRPYRQAWREDKVFDYIRDQSGEHFDPRVVETFLKLPQNFKRN